MTSDGKNGKTTPRKEEKPPKNPINPKEKELAATHQSTVLETNQTSEKAPEISSSAPITTQEQGKAITRASISIRYEGPLPPASEFAKYEKAVPGAGKIILHMAEEEPKRLKERDRQIFEINLARIRTARLISVASLLVAALCAYLDREPLIIISFGALGLITLVGQAVAQAIRQILPSKTKNDPEED